MQTHVNSFWGEGFADIRRGDHYVDKTGLIAFMNGTLGTSNNLILSSRPRCFGKTFDLTMLACYYSKSCSSRDLFADLKIASDPTFERYLNKCDVLAVYIPEFTFCSSKDERETAVERMEFQIAKELKEEFPECAGESHSSIAELMLKISLKTGRKFIILIDSWDCFFREYPYDRKLHRQYLLFLRKMFKNESCQQFVLGAYMTGVLPIAPGHTRFRNFTMFNPGELSDYIGFTADEVQKVCAKLGLDNEVINRRYAGYPMANGQQTCCPRAVMRAAIKRQYLNYWTETAAWSALTNYINLNFTGLRDAWRTLLSGGRCPIAERSFCKDLVSMQSRDDVLTLLVHLGYLAYDAENKSAFIPNDDVYNQFVYCVGTSSHKSMLRELGLPLP